MTVNLELGYDEDADWGMLPRYMHEGLKRYLTDHVEPGDFLSAVLRNDLMDACARADETNQHLLWHYVYFLHNYAHPASYGSEAYFEAWIKRGRG